MAQQDQIPDELKIVIQGMIDAKEPPEAINSVIQAYSEGKLKIPPPTAKPSQIGIISPKSETEGYWGGVRSSLGFGGTVDQRTREILKQYVAGGILDLPQTAMGLGKHVFDRVGGAITEPVKDLYNLPSRLSAASNADLVGMGLKSVGEMSGVPSLYREGKDIYNTLGNVWDTAANSGTDEGGKKWGRLMGQMTLQPLVTEGAIKLGGQVPVRDIYRGAATPIRSMGGPIEKAGQWIQYGAKEFPPYMIMRKKRWGGKIIGGGLEKIGSMMKEAGLTQEEINAAALKDFWGDEFGGNVAPRNRGGKGGPPGGGSGGGGGTSDVWGDALKKERNRRFNFDATPENPLTNEFNKPLRGGLQPPEYEPSLPFGKGGEPSGGDLPLEGEQSGLNPEIKKISDKIKAVTIQNSSPRKTAILKEQGFEPVGEIGADGSQRFERTKPVTEEVKSTDTTEKPPEVIPVAGLKKADIREIVASGLYEYGKDAEGLGQYTLKKSEVKGQVGGKEPPATSNDEGGTTNWRTTYLKLREQLGRDPSAAEIESAMSQNGPKKLGTKIQSSGMNPDDYHAAKQELDARHARGEVVDYEDELDNLNQQHGVIDTMTPETETYVKQIRRALDEGYMGLHPNSPHLPELLKSGAKVVDKLDDGTLILDNTGQGPRVSPEHPDAPKRFGQGKGAGPGEQTGRAAPFPSQAKNLFEITREIDKHVSNPEYPIGAMKATISRAEELINGYTKSGQARIDYNEIQSLIDKSTNPDQAEALQHIADLIKEKGNQLNATENQGFGQPVKIKDLKKQGVTNDNPDSPYNNPAGEPIKSVGNVTPITPKFNDPSREWYQLPDGRIIPVDSTATKGVKSFDFPLKDGTMVKATRIDQPEIEPHGMYGPEYKANPRTNATDKFESKPEILPQDKWDQRQSSTPYDNPPAETPEEGALRDQHTTELEKRLSRPASTDQPVEGVPPGFTREEANAILETMRANRSTDRPVQFDIHDPANEISPSGDVSEIRRRNVLGPRPVHPSDTPIQLQMGQQELPWSRGENPQPIDADEGARNRSYAAQRLTSAPYDIGPVQQSMMPNFGDAEISDYLKNEDARPPEMNDINTFRPPHSPDKISFMQKLKDMLDQEDQWA